VCEHFGGPRDAVFDHRGEQFVLVAKDIVDRHQRRVDGTGDAACGGAGRALMGNDVDRGVDQLLSPIVGLHVHHLVPHPRASAARLASGRRRRIRRAAPDAGQSSLDREHSGDR
jgi:hypothetical protein